MGFVFKHILGSALGLVYPLGRRVRKPGTTTEERAEREGTQRKHTQKVQLKTMVPSDHSLRGIAVQGELSFTGQHRPEQNAAKLIRIWTCKHIRKAL